ELVLFERSVKAPWRSFVADKNGSEDINSSVAKNNAVSYRTRDRQVQEDIMAISFNGNGEGRFGFRELFPNDLRGFFESGALLKLSLRVEKIPTDKVMLAMLCESGCAGTLDITKKINALALNNWSELEIPLNCFEQSDFDKSKVTAPLVIETKGEFSLSLFGARIVVVDKDAGTHNC
ncbi:MAG: putative glycoside hydrolase, partial [Kangiellaceae bacterium]|nr:putative glycoside hydrolase [Kangiellaceae bacterium]